MSGSMHVLLVEDDPRLAALTARYFEQHGVTVTTARDGASAVTAAQSTTFDAVLLDLSLPGLDGLEVCRRLRARTDVPLLMVTARIEEADRVLGLESGADDYVLKPFSSRELLARVRAHVRRARGGLRRVEPVLRIGALTLDPGALEVRRDGERIPLTAAEFAVLYAMATRPGHVFTREQLLDLARHGADEAFDRTVDVTIFRIRQKLEPDPSKPVIVRTVRGAGYLFARPTAEAP
jgi:DNA-binding response OmpR family regulator